MKEKKELTHEDLRCFMGDLDRYRSINQRVIYTPGVKYLADAGEAHWLVDAIASYYGTKTMEQAMAKDGRIQTLQFWRLDVHANDSATLTARADNDVPPFITQEILYTDFPLEHADIWAGRDKHYWVLYLPSEH